MGAPCLFGVILVLSLNAGAWNGRNQALRDIPDQTWVKVCGFQGYYPKPGMSGGAAEVPWAYDANKRVFVRYGGCTSTYSNECSFFDLGDTTWTFPWPYDATAPTDRPGCGCNRGLCYDAVTRHVWSVGSASSGCSAGGRGIWKGDMTARTWSYAKDLWGNQGHVACDTAARKIVCSYWDMGSGKNIMVYDTRTDSAHACPSMPGKTAKGVGYPVDYWYALEYVPVMQGVMMVGHMRADSANGYKEGWFTWIFNTQTETWTDLGAGGLTGTIQRAILSYDPVAQVVLLMISGGRGLFAYTPGGSNTWEKVVTATGPLQDYSTMYGYGWSEMFEYDPEHNVHVFAALYPFQRVWAFRYANEPASRAQMRGLRLVRPSIDCHPNPFNASTTLFISGIRTGEPSTLRIYNIFGQEIVDLTQAVNDGKRQIPWTGIATLGNIVPSGRYCCTLISGAKTANKSIILMK